MALGVHGTRVPSPPISVVKLARKNAENDPRANSTVIWDILNRMRRRTKKTALALIALLVICMKRKLVPSARTVKKNVLVLVMLMAMKKTSLLVVIMLKARAGASSANDHGEFVWDTRQNWTNMPLSTL